MLQTMFRSKDIGIWQFLAQNLLEIWVLMDSNRGKIKPWRQILLQEQAKLSTCAHGFSGGNAEHQHPEGALRIVLPQLLENNPNTHRDFQRLECQQFISEISRTGLNNTSGIGSVTCILRKVVFSIWYVCWLEYSNHFTSKSSLRVYLLCIICNLHLLA